MVGVDPGPLTLRELVWMAEARTRHTWAQTSAVLALVANVHRDPKKTRPFQPADFHPLLKQPETLIRADVSVLKQVFVDSRK